MYTHLKNYIEDTGAWNTKRVIFVDFKESQEVEFIRDEDNYSIKYTELKTELIIKEYRMDKDKFYNKLKIMVNETLFNPEHYKFEKYNKLETLLSLWFNVDKI